MSGANKVMPVPHTRWDHQDNFDDDWCNVALADGRPVNIELIDPADHLDLLDRAAARYELDAESLQASARAALAAPDRIVELDVHAREVA
ncbi:hypothetical protein [Capillimicrobium parvum]|uniref:Uncharacterized protein n=1 Tax=Capillimicrobium parvum TaxID=2884022 RepID=A0A9E6XWP2_9ACTN|nr:hypothetical protein [Capillimicrobium parvum]UGS35121.1 hypothetical protein DSM104329_01506 [Capillimicrobium parvum]